MSDMKDYDMDVVLAKVGYHLHEYTDGRLAKLASTLPEGSEERSLVTNLVGSLRIVDDSARVALAKESLRVKEEDPDNREENIMAEVMFGIMANSYLDARSREVVYRVLHKALFGTEVSSEEAVTFHGPRTAPSPEHSVDLGGSQEEEDRWAQMVDYETVYDGPERRSRGRLLTEFTQYAEALVHYVTTDDPLDDMDRGSMRWAIRGLRYSAQYFKDNPVAVASLEQGEQPLALGDDGVIRFRENRIIRLLLDGGPFDLNQIALMAFSDQERQQLAQLIGYSVSGYGDLTYAFGEPVERADRAVDIFIAEQEAGA